jgi:hypothetical protein
MFCEFIVIEIVAGCGWRNIWRVFMEIIEVHFRILVIKGIKKLTLFHCLRIIGSQANIAAQTKTLRTGGIEGIQYM